VLVTPLRLCAQVPTGAAIRSEIQQAVRTYVDAWNQADASKLVEQYSRQAGVTSVGDGEIIRGWDRIRERFDSLVGTAGRFKLAIGSN
jgi:ketosteroid isomerase-like protein